MKTLTSAPASPAFDLRKHLVVAGVVFAFTLAVRLVFLLTSVDKGWPHSVNYEGDAVIWAQAAELFARGDVPDEGVPHRFYAIAHMLQWLGAPGRAAAYLPFKVAWCALSALSCAVGYLLFARNFAPRVAWIATALCALSFGSTVLATSLNVEGLYAPILILILGGTLELARRPSWGLVGALAVLNGLALLTREEHLVLMLFLAGYLCWRWWRPTADVHAPSVRRRLAMLGALTAGAIILCLPYSVQATRATVRYNTIPRRPPAFDAEGVTWTAEARTFIDSLPAFLRAKTVAAVTEHARRQGTTTVGDGMARDVLLQRFGTLPEALATPVFIASHGPMSFALSNHPDSNGGFSRAALATSSQTEPRLNLTLPEHLRIFNHGYAVGWGFIVADVPRWMGNVGKKLAHAYQGASMGFTAYNLPWGRFGQRRSCDLLTPLPGAGLPWRLFFAALLALGAVVAWSQPAGRLFLLVIAYKTLIVVAYYGYARQTVSILPAFLVIAALGADRALSMGPRRLQLPIARRAAVGMGVVLFVAVWGIELHAATHPPQYRIVGAIRPTPQWGDAAFSANAPIEVQSEGRNLTRTNN